MESHFQLTDSAFEQQFADGILPPALFNHEAHLRLAWIYINRYGIETALSIICLRLTNYVELLGASDKFNKTLTIAATKAVFHFLQKSKSSTFGSFIIEFPRLKYEFKALLNCHYSTDIFLSERAKKEFLEPDLLPF